MRRSIQLSLLALASSLAFTSAGCLSDDDDNNSTPTTDAGTGTDSSTTPTGDGSSSGANGPGILSVWDVETGVLLVQLNSHPAKRPGALWWFKFSPDGRLLASVDHGWLKLWNVSRLRAVEKAEE